MVKNNKLLNFLLSFVAFPATLVGVYTMNYFNVPKHFWVINLASVLFFSILSFLFYKNVFRLKKINPIPILVLAVILLLSTFVSQGLDGVHRWVGCGSIQLNTGLIISPIILLLISREANLYYCISIFTFSTIVFLLQSDASLVTSFSVPATILMIDKLKSNIAISVLVLMVLFAVIFSWYNLDHLQPVTYVEGIMNLTKRISAFVFFIAILSLLLLTLPFFINHSKQDKILPCLGLYYTLLIVSSFFGNFPVIIMGYGISPIIGYFSGLFFLIEKKKTMS